MSVRAVGLTTGAVVLTVVVVALLSPAERVPPARPSSPHIAITSQARVTRSPHPGTPVARTWPAPDDRLTPGAVVRCALPRPASERHVSAVEKDQVAAAYGYAGPRGLRYLEFDHRVPFALCGSNGPTNLWPERYDGVPTTAFVHNRKDQLELLVTRKVRDGELSLRQAQSIFLGDWRQGWCRYVHDPITLCR